MPRVSAGALINEMVSSAVVGLVRATVTRNGIAPASASSAAATMPPPAVQLPDGSPMSSAVKF